LTALPVHLGTVAQERPVEVEADESVVDDGRPVGEEKAFRRYDP
jgi:hypothetical protein